MNILTTMSDIAKKYNMVTKTAKISMPPLDKDDGTYVYSDQEKANYIAHFFIDCVQFLSLQEKHCKLFMNVFMQINNTISQNIDEMCPVPDRILRILQHIEKFVDKDHWIRSKVLSLMPNLQ